MELTVPNILSLAQYSEYITAARIGGHLALEGADINETWARLIYMERMSVQNRYNLNPSDSTLQGTANYLFSILRYISEAMARKNNLAGGLPVITGPANQSVTVGSTATFSVSVTSSTSVTYQWYVNNVLIPGATSSSYLVTNAQLTQSGGLYSVSATNSAGTITSNQVTLTVTASLQGFFYYTNTDPGPTLRASSDPFTYQETFAITSGQPWIMPVPVAATPNQFIVVKGPVGESIKTQWNNGGINSGFIPDVNWQTEIAFGGMQYYYTRQSISLDPTQTLTLT